MSPLLAKRLSDESLGSRLAAGEAAAFDELYRRYVHRLAAYGAHLLGDGAAGDDVAQAALLKAYGALRDGRVPDRVKPWLYRIAHNVAIDLVVRRREWPTAELPERSASDAAPLAGVLVEALSSLPERQRRVYVLRELHGLRIDETAAELSLSAAQVEQSLFAARNRLAEYLTFGDRLTCVSVQRLAAGPLDNSERRALKSHLRSCASCRNSACLRGRALSALPVTSLDWLRGLLAGAVGGGAPVGAKVGAAVMTMTLAAGVPAAVETVHVHRLPVVPATRVQPHSRAGTQAGTESPPRASVVQVERASATHHVVAVNLGSQRSGRHGGELSSRSGEALSGGSGPDGGEAPATGSSSGGPGGGSSGRSGDGDRLTTSAVVVQSTPAGGPSSSGPGPAGTATVTTNSDGGQGSGGPGGSSDGGGSHDGGGDGGGDTPTSTVPSPSG